MNIKIKNEQTGNVFSKHIECSVSAFYCIEDDILDDFIDKLENKYNATMDFKGGDDYIQYNIYEIDDETLFEIILDKLRDFILKYA